MSLSPASQLVIRNIDQFEEGNWLVINADDAGLFPALQAFSLTALHQFFDVFCQATGRNGAAQFDSRDICEEPQAIHITAENGQHKHVFAPYLNNAEATDVLLFLPKAKAHLSMLMAMAANLVGNNGRVHVVGENKGGIKSAGKTMQQFGAVQKLDSARHCSWVTCEVSNAPGSFSLHDWTAIDTYTLNEHEWQVCSLPGVFSHRELDAGTELLLSKLSKTMSGSVLDFACGAGVIASYLLSGGARIQAELLDVSALALWCSAHTLEQNGSQGNIIAADTLNGVTHRFQTIVTNPPFHTGVKTDYRITREFIAGAKQRLTSNGKLYLVANRFLPYAELLDEQFKQPATLAQNTRFSVYFAQN